MKKYEGTTPKNGVIIFSSNTCGACRMVKPSLEKLEEEMNVEVIDVNIMINSDFANENEVKTLPTLLFIKNNEVFDKLTGFLPEQELKKRFDKIVGDL